MEGSMQLFQQLSKSVFHLRSNVLAATRALLTSWRRKIKENSGDHSIMQCIATKIREGVVISNKSKAVLQVYIYFPERLQRDLLNVPLLLIKHIRS
jgi:hypothetical protein